MLALFEKLNGTCKAHMICDGVIWSAAVAGPVLAPYPVA